jgi:hypothetical protein
MVARSAFAVSALAAVCLFANTSSAADVDNTASSAPPVDIRGAVPIVAYTYSATGAPAKTMGAYAYGTGVVSSGDKVGGGGVTAWASPIDRLTIVADAQRNIFGEFGPSAAAIVRLFGKPNDGFSLGAIGKFKVDGFAMGPNKEMESEIEGGVLLSYARAGYHLDMNAITGFGTGDDGEIDTEGRLRFGKDIADMVRVGVDGQGRYRLAGDTKLIGGRTWDFAAGPQLMIGSSHFFGSLTAGPTYMNVASGVGWTGIISLGGASF